MYRYLDGRQAVSRSRLRPAPTAVLIFLSLMRVLYSFPHKIGAARICYTAWEQVRGLASAGSQVIVFPGAVSRGLPENVTVRPTLARGRLRIPYKLLGRMGACVLHDRVVARRLEKMADEVDIIHCWPLGSLETLKAAKRLGIPAVLERPNAHTRFCYETVAAECHRIGVSMPHHDYEPDPRVLAREEKEFDQALGLLCPSEFTVQSFIDKGIPREKLLRHTYGFDESAYYPAADRRAEPKKFTAIFVGVDAVRKGLHLALEAWLSSPASHDGTFLIAGELSSEYRNRFAAELSHSSVVQLGHRNDVPELMRKADVLLMPSLEEGFGLVCVEAIGSGCVPLASRACTEVCQHMHNALVHEIGDTKALQAHITLLYENRDLLRRLRETCIDERLNYTWTAAGQKLLGAYQTAIDKHAAFKSESVLGRIPQTVT
jgi:glycosyltransferase involved in cell wall biosynthesis